MAARTLTTLKKALIIGGNRGFGKRLAERLKATACQVTLINRHGTGPGDRVIKADRNDLKLLTRQVGNEEWDAIFDLAANVPNDCESAFKLFKKHTGQYVLVSSISVYRLGRDLTEDNFNVNAYVVPDTTKRTLTYSEGKRAVEAIYAKSAPFPFVAVRFPFILGPDDYTMRLEYHIQANKTGRRIFFANRNAAMSVISSKEASEFLHAVARRKRLTGFINFASATPLTYIDLMSVISSVTKKDPLFATKQSDLNTSPYDYASDKFMSLSKAKKLGFQPASTYGWFPDLVRSLVK
jgi:nucleoside-diphosphate-sugar epimerase